MPSRKLAGLVFGVTLLVPYPAAARAADDQKPAPAQTEDQKKTDERKKAEEQKKAQERQQATPKSAPLRFTDDDLEAFHKRPPRPPDEEEADGEIEESVQPIAAPPPPSGSGVRPPGPPAPAAVPKGPRPVTRPVVRPPGIAPRPQDDPLKPFRDREAKEKFRAEQIQRMRDRLAGIDKRLEHLKARKLGVLDPLVGMPAPRDGDDAPGEAAMRPRDLLEKIDLEIKGLEQEKEQVQADLVSIETRFSHETQSR